SIGIGDRLVVECAVQRIRSRDTADRRVGDLFDAREVDHAIRYLCHLAAVLREIADDIGSTCDTHWCGWVDEKRRCVCRDVKRLNDCRDWSDDTQRRSRNPAKDPAQLTTFNYPLNQCRSIREK